MFTTQVGVNRVTYTMLFKAVLWKHPVAPATKPSAPGRLETLVFLIEIIILGTLGALGFLQFFLGVQPCY